MAPTPVRCFAISYLSLSILLVSSAFAQATVQAQADPTPPSGVEVEIGMGSRIGRQISNYQSSNGVLSLTNLGRATPQLLTGLGFVFCESPAPAVPGSPVPPQAARDVAGETGKKKFGFCRNAVTSRLGVFVTAQFGAGSTDVISGYSLGMTVGLSRYLRGLVGFSLTPVNEASPGFITAASQYVAKNPTLFPGITAANLSSNAYAAYDGIQYTNTVPAPGSMPTSVVYYPGSVTTTHYRGGLLIGVAFPINVYKLVSGNKTGQ